MASVFYGRVRGAVLSLLFLWVGSLSAGQPPASAIASAHPLATRAGFEILESGGNAFDAAVAVSAALAVVEPSGSGMGGGGFWLLHRASDSFQVMIDGRERAPLAASRDMYLDASGRFDQSRSINGALAAGIPGMPAAIVHLAGNYGRLPLKQSLKPAIRLAREGFFVDRFYRQLLAFRLDVMREYPAAASIFLHNNEVPAVGFRLVQSDLARTLERLGEQGRAGFYQGEVAGALVAGVREAGGIWSLQDLNEYRVVEREPIRFEYRGIRVTSAAPPSSGGVVLGETLNILEGFDLGSTGGAVRKHLVIEAMRRAYRDRSLYLGDPDFVKMPLQKLLSPEYAAGLRSGIDPRRATEAPAQGRASEGAATEGRNTTHFSVLDREGNRVSATLSVNYPFGSCVVPPGTGVLLNDEMDDFVGLKGAGNIYGLVGGDANSIEPGKRMLSSMTPTFLEDQDRVAILGTPGGSRIISMVLLGVLDFADGNGPESWVRVPRYHHQFSPDQVQYEQHGLGDREIRELQRMGHSLKEKSRRYGNMQAILWDKRNHRVSAASDPRKSGFSLVK